MRSPGLQAFSEDLSSCRPGALTGRFFTCRLGALTGRFFTCRPGALTGWLFKHALSTLAALLICVSALAQLSTLNFQLSTPAYLTTNGPAVFATSNFTILPRTFTNSHGSLLNGPQSRGIPALMTNFVFDHFLPGSLNHLVWTNLIAHTNGRSARVWSVRTRPAGWPASAPVVAWDTNCLMWGMKGLTALSPCWQDEGNPGQVPITALTRRHGYTRGHSMGAGGFRALFAGKKVWFLAANDTLIQATVAREVVRTWTGQDQRDYTLLLFSNDLPASIEPLRGITFSNLLVAYPSIRGAPWPIFKTEQAGYVSADIPGFTLNTFKGGDSGSPNLLPLPGELVFFGGRSTSGPSPEMQTDMDELCRLQNLDPKRYQLQWVNLAAYAP